jgi:multidrug resistance efflux pump
LAFVDTWKGSSELSRIEVGETARWGQLLCKIADPTRMQVVVVVNEVDALEVHRGQPAAVRFTAFPGAVVRGKVASVASTARDRNELLGSLALEKAGRAGVSAVEVVVELDEQPSGLRGGNTALVEILPDGNSVPAAGGARPSGAPAKGASR